MNTLSGGWILSWSHWTSSSVSCTLDEELCGPHPPSVGYPKLCSKQNLKWHNSQVSEPVKYEYYYIGIRGKQIPSVCWGLGEITVEWMTNWLPPMCRKMSPETEPSVQLFQEITQSSYTRLQIEVISSLLFTCGVERERQKSELRKQHDLEDKIWQIQSGSVVKATSPRPLLLQKCVLNPPTCHIKYLPSPDTQNQQ